MSDPIDGGYQDRKEKRFRLQASDLAVRVSRRSKSGTETGDAEAFEALPIDVSYSGIKLRSNRPLQFEEVLGLEFTSDTAEVNFKAAAEVRWTRKDEGEVWVIGCRIATGLTEDAINKLSTAGALERRRGRRTITNLIAELMIPGEAMRRRITILDYSGQGVRFSSPVEVPVGKPLKIVLRNDLQYELEVVVDSRWCRSFDSGYLVGCEVSKGYQTKFRRWMEWLSKAPEEEERSPLMVAAWAAVAISYALVFLF